ncbi:MULTISPECIES: hypothetical protein [Lacticaseibacillus]|uniref:hypothetical protein n=1 Tax=Lacticaseibacillus TaxID=2759736 RepID=UPI001CD33898|nr:MULTISPECIES: hypothetical protein [Lacticaseibacillus]
MPLGIKGALIGVLLAVSILQWGFLGLLLIVLLAVAGFVIERWLLSNKDGLLAWLRQGEQRLKNKS